MMRLAFLSLIGVKKVICDISEIHRAIHESSHLYARALKEVILRWRRPIIVTLDLGLMVTANYLAFWLRFDGDIPETQIGLFWQMLPWLMLVRGAAFVLFRLNEGLWRYTSMWDLQCIISGVFISTLGFYCLVEWIFGVTGFPRAVYIVDSILLVGFLAGVRLPSRLLRSKGDVRRRKKVLIVGAGDSGER